MSRIVALSALAAIIAVGGASAGIAHAARARAAALAEAAQKARPAPPASSAPKHADGQAAAPAGVPEARPFGGLLGLDEAGARATLGRPDIARAEGAGALWTYRLPDCSLFVFFKRAPGLPLKVSGAASGPRVRGQAPLPVESCIAQAKQVQPGPAGVRAGAV